MRRWVRRITIFLLLGAMVNVAVAWGIALNQPPADGGPADFLYSHTDEPRWCFVTQRAAGSEYVLAGRTTFADVSWKYAPLTTPSWSMVAQKPVATPEDDDAFWFETARGWPWLSMAGRVRIAEDYSANESRFAALLSQGDSSSLPRFLPLRPLLPGFGANSFVYGATLWAVVAGSLAGRRRYRTRRGLCPACGYPRGKSPVCTECGQPLATPSARARSS